MTDLVGKTAEYAVIGTVLRYPESDVVAQVLASTAVSYFDTPPCRAIREVLSEFDNKPFDLSIVRSRLEQRGYLGDPVTPEFLTEVVTHAPLPITLTDHIQTLRTYNATRNALTESQGLHETLKTVGGDSEGLVTTIDNTIVRLGELMMNVGNQEWVKIGTSAQSLLERVNDDKPTEFFSTGFPKLDELLGGGFGTGQLVTIAARPGFGKSTLALDFARNFVFNGVPTLHFSIEMSEEENTARFLGGAASINSNAIRKGELTPTERQTLEHWLKKTNEAPLFINTNEDLQFHDIMTTYYRLNAELKAQTGQEIKVISVDYLQLLEAERRFPNRQEEVSFYSRSAKKMAKKNDLVFIALAQLNRGGKNSDVEHDPKPSDLRESGAIEQDSDVIILLGKDESEEMDQPRGRMKGIVGKNRNGPTGVVPLTFMSSYPRFEESDEEFPTNSVENWDDSEWND